MSNRKRKPESIGSIVDNWLGASGLAARVDQAEVVPEWPMLVGPQIARVTTPQSVTANGTLFVAVTTSAWMNELSLLEPELLRSINSKAGRAPVTRIRWVLGRGPS
jgi:predicted nucleic acid-binding Zn ribbon protein